MTVPSDKEIITGAKNFVKHMANFTKLLLNFDTEGKPISQRSGFLYESNDVLYVITALHGKIVSPVYIETNLVVDGKCVALSAGDFHYLQNINTPNDFIDIACSRFPIETIRDQISKDPKLAGQTISMLGYRGPICLPIAGEAYGFCSVKGEHLVPTDRGYNFEKMAVAEVGMEYVSDNIKGEHLFALSGKFKGDEIYRGCSGSPVCDPNKRVVSILLGRESDSQLLRGANLTILPQIIKNLP